MKDKIKKELAKCGSKHIGVRVKSLGYLPSIIKITSYLPDNVTNSQRIWHILNETTEYLCSCNNSRKFIGLTKGYSIGCTLKCPDSKQSRIDKCTEYQQSLTDYDRAHIENKRRDFCLKYYKHTAQGFNQRKQHTAYYSDPVKKQSTIDKVKATNLLRYAREGVTHPSQLNRTKEKQKATMLLRYDVENAFQLNSTKKARSKIILDMDKINRTRFNNKYDALVKELKNYKLEILCKKEDFTGVYNKTYEYKHSCGNKFTYTSLGGDRNIPTCRKCCPINSFKSKQEIEIYKFVKELYPDAYQSDRKIIKPQELDIVIPSKKIAIEYCGIYWHTENGPNKTEKNYHFNKTKNAKTAGYRLITIFDNEWNDKKEIVKERLRNILGVNKSRYGARCCKIRNILNKEIKYFTNKIHIQGHRNASVYYGAYYNEKLVAIMSFMKGAKITGTKEVSWEIVRFCSKYSIPGIASKLFKTFIKEYNPNKVISYCDLRWNTGLVYEKIGMILSNKPAPGYWYTNDYKILHHRYTFAKHILVKKYNQPKELTEQEIMLNLGYDKIWDCGQARFEIKFYD